MYFEMFSFPYFFNLGLKTYGEHNSNNFKFVITYIF